jgi:hypothetical protein
VIGHQACRSGGEGLSVRPMRRLLHWLTLVALLLAPLAAPAAAAVRSARSDCHEMEMGKAHHEVPPAKHHARDSCCLAIPAAIDPPLTALEGTMPLGHLQFAASVTSFALGAGPSFEDPPPRFS